MDKAGTTENIKILTELIVCGVFGTVLSESTAEKLTPEKLGELFVISSQHEMAHIVGSCLEKNKLLADGILGSAFRQEMMAALYRYEKLNFGFKQVCDLLEEEQVPFFPLKGAVIHSIYPEEWMRVGCDVDILVHREDKEKVRSLFTEKLNYSFCGETFHDVAFVSSDGVVFEIHHTLTDEDLTKNTNKILDGVWEYSRPAENSRFRRRLTDDMLYFYHIAHIAKHIVRGGCGIKPVLDLYVMERLMKPPSKALLKKGGLLQFEKSVMKLCNVWFDGDEADEITLLFQQYVLEGGIYGSRENMSGVHIAQSGGKARYIFSRIFLPYSKLKYEYPVLRKRKYLFLFYTVYRWFCLIFKGDKQSRIKNLELVNTASEEKSSQIAELLSEIGL